MRESRNDKLRRLIIALIESGPMAARLQNVLVSSQDYGTDDTIVRIIVFVNDVDKLDRAEAEAIRQQIRDLVDEVDADERFPSVRFSEAA